MPTNLAAQVRLQRTMTSRSQLENAIAEALTTLSPENLQRVAEDYARIRYPDRFPRFDFRAFSAQGKSRQGWPDAWIEIAGSIDGVEATGAKERSKVEEHLWADLDRANTLGSRLAGLIVISGHPAVQFSDNEVTTWRRRFTKETGIRDDRFQLIFGIGLVEELSRPEFARTRLEVLGLPVAPKHFKLFLGKRGPDELRLGDFIPSDDDFALGHVYRPEIADQVLLRLDETGIALVRGVGACGKSVLAWLLGLEVTAQRRPAYALDLADYVQANPETGTALVEDLHRFSHPQVLFVLDNCHLNEPLAKEFTLAWDMLPRRQQPQLLLLARELQTSRKSLIANLGGEPLILRARQSALLGVYLRLARRSTNNRNPPVPPPEVLDKWVATFGGDPHSLDTTTDLIAFSAAVHQRMGDLTNGRWALSESDAIFDVRSVYLNSLSRGETYNLMRLCALAEMELSIGEEALADRFANYELCSKRYGIVFKSAVGKHIRYRLAHPALGPLILRASPEPIDLSAERFAIARQSPQLGVTIVSRLAATDRLAEAREFVSRMLLQPSFLLNLETLAHVRWAIRLIEELGLALPEDIGQVLTMPSERSALIELVVRTPLGHLTDFLSYASKVERFAPVFLAIAVDLTKPANKTKLLTLALATSLDHLMRFLAYVRKTPRLQPIYTGLVADLSDLQACAALSEQSLKAPLHHLAGFLGYVHSRPELETVCVAVVDHISRPDSRRALITKSLDGRLDHLTNFLTFIGKTPQLRPLRIAIAADLLLPQFRKALISRALQTGLADLMAYAAKTTDFEPVYRELVADARQPENRKALVAQALELRLGILENFLACLARIDELALVHSAIGLDLSQLENRRTLLGRALKSPLGDLTAFLRYAAMANGFQPVYAGLADDLGVPENRTALLAIALKAPFGDLTGLLRYAAEAKGLRQVYAGLAQDLARPESRAALLGRLLESPLADITSFLKYAINDEELQPVFAALVDGLSRHNNREKLILLALQSPLDALASFLANTRNHRDLRPIYSLLCARLEQPERKASLVMLALKAPLQSLRGFLQHAAATDELARVYATLAESLAEPTNRRRIAAAMEREPLDAVVNVLRSPVARNLWASAFAEIDEAAWLQARRAQKVCKIDSFVEFQRLAIALNRPELARALAIHLVTASTPSDWHQKAIGLHHLSHVLLFAKDAGSEDIRAFLQAVATPNWIDGRLRMASTGGLAGTLLALFMQLDPSHRTWLIQGALRQRVLSELALLQGSEVDSRASIIRLLGSAAVVGLSFSAVDVYWPNTQELAEIVALRNLEANRKTIGPIEVQLWLGLREMAHLRADPVRVPPLGGERILSLWQHTHPSNAKLPPHVEALHATMIAWLQQCQAADWFLVPEQVSNDRGN
jgi:hypothetical protein